MTPTQADKIRQARLLLDEALADHHEHTGARSLCNGKLEQPGPDVETLARAALVAACRAAREFVMTMRVPQDLLQAGEQVGRGGRLVEVLEAALRAAGEAGDRVPPDGRLVPWDDGPAA